MSEKIIKGFTFHVPVELEKSKDEEAIDSWKIQGIASTSDEDLQGETVDQSGLDISLLKAGRGIFNEDHRKGVEFVLGQIEDAEFIDIEGKKALFVKGYLFKHQEKAKAYYNIMKSLKKGSTHRVHFSIEGKILQRDFSNPKAIVKARIDKVALTLDPVNPVTYCSLAKSLASISENIDSIQPDNSTEEESIIITKSDLLKMLSAGIGHSKAPEARVGGEATQVESLDRKIKNVTYGKFNKKVLKSVINKIIKECPNWDELELAKLVLERYETRKKEANDGN